MERRSFSMVRRRVLRAGLLVLLLSALGVGAFGVEAASGQATLRGFVTDSTSGEPLQGVNVILTRLEADSPPTGAATDADGLYTIAGLEPAAYELRVSYVGYDPYVDTLEIAAEEVHRRDVALVPTQGELEEVVVQAREQRGAANVSGGTQTVTAEELALVPTPDVSGDLASFLTNQPGVTTTGDQGGQVYIRGGEPTQNLTLVEGVPVYRPFHVLGFYSAFSSSWVQSADVHAGGYGARYSGRISSVIDVRARSGNKNRWEGTASISPFLSSVQVEGPLVPGHVSVLASARESLLEEGAERYVNRPLPYDFGDRFGKIHATIGPTYRLSAFGLHTHDSGQLSFGIENERPDRIAWTNTALGVRQQLLHGSAPMSADIVTGYSHMDTQLGPSGDPVRTSGLESVNVGVHARWTGGWAHFDWGVFFRNTTTTAEFGGLFQNVDSQEMQLPAFGVYLEPDLQIGDHVFLRPGLVGMGFGQSGTFLEPRLQLRYQRGPHSFTLAGGQYHQEVIGLQDRRDVTSIFTGWTGPLEGEIPQAQHLVLGYQGEVTPWLDVSVEGYAKRFENLFISEWTALPELTTEVQPARGRVGGFDARLEVTLGDVYGYIGYGLASVRYEATGEAISRWYGTESLSFNPPHDRRHQINMLIQSSWRGFEGSLRWNLGTGRPYSRALGFDGFVAMRGPVDVFSASDRKRVIYGPPYNARLPAYHRLDVSVKRSFSLDWATVTAQVSAVNAYNRANIFAIDLFTLERTDQLPVVPSFGLQISTP